MNRLDCIARLQGQAPAILPSMLQCDFTNLHHEIEQLRQADFSTLHLDVMDGVFVPNFSYGMTIVAAARKCTESILDVHLMMVQPEKYVQQFRDAGADVMTVHAEASQNLIELLERIKDLDAVAGVAINPATPLAAIESCLPHTDLVLVMSVNAGFGGQTFDSTVLRKLEDLRDRHDHRLLMQIDGGINQETIGVAHRAGASLLVVGSAIFQTDDYRLTHQRLKAQLGGNHERI